jgi:hypothetical protein
MGPPPPSDDDDDDDDDDDPTRCDDATIDGDDDRFTVRRVDSSNLDRSAWGE